MARTLLLAIPILLFASTPMALADSYAWDDSTCASGGSWVNPDCWSGPSYPDGIDDSAFLQLDFQGNVGIPTSSIMNITLNSLHVTENVALNVNNNMFLILTQSSMGANPSLQIDNVLTVNSPNSGSSSLRSGTPLNPDETTELSISGSGEIRLGSNGGLESSTRSRIEMNGGIEVVSSASVNQPARINAELRNIGGEIRVLGGPLIMMGDIENVGGGFVEIYDQYNTGNSEIRLVGKLRGGKLYPGLGIVRVNGGELSDIEIQPGPVEVGGNIGYFSGPITLSSGTEVTVPPTRTLQIGSSFEAGAPLIENDGVIRIGDPQGGAATLRTDGSLVELEGNGTVILQHLGCSLATLGGGAFRNGPNHTLEGAGYIQCPVQNEGLLVVDGGPMVLFSSITGPNGETVILGDATTAARLTISAGFSTRDMRVSEHGELYVNNGRSVVVHGDYVVETQDESAITWNSNTQLIFSGAGPGQAFETTSEDLLASNAGFTGNFAIRRVVVGQTGTSVYLRDLRDNGNRASGDEAVYANVLEVQPGAILNLNGYCFYTMLNGSPYRVQAGDGALFGGGTIVDDPNNITAVDDAPVGARLAELQVAPNPFNPRTTIRFEVDAFSHGSVSIYDLRGRQVRDLGRGPWSPGVHELVWDGTDDAGRGLASGVYAVRVRAGGANHVQRVTLLK